MRHIPKIIFALLASIGLSACMSTDIERAGAGAVIGGLGAAALNANPVTGAVIGGAAGALCDDVNLC
ncbi:hypothetical protein HKCCE2091_10700 [Rhodobacterales bacterium HKCCE2091]|nr:hypothetical protein [Rhodobacterales bacterium HKCCE2091]